jgi:hypothetical protein
MLHLSGRRIAYATMISMLALSIAGNVAHTYHLDPTPGIRSLVYAVAWPVMVWLGVELFVRVPWQAKASHHLVRWVGILLVAFIAALVSYRHLRGLLKADGEEWTVYTFGPLAVDGLMLMATLALLLTRSLPRDLDAAPKLTLAQRVAAARQTALDVKAAALQAPAAAEVPVVDPVPEDLVPEDPVPGDPAVDPVPEDLVPVGTRTQRGSIDYAQVLRAVLKMRKDQDVADATGGSAKTAQRVRRAVKLLDTTQDLEAIASTVKLPLTAVHTIAAGLKSR